MESNRSLVLPKLSSTTIGRIVARVLIALFVIGDMSIASAIVRGEPRFEIPPVSGGTAAAVSVFGPRDYVRSTGKPIVETGTFAAAPGSAMLHITNGGSQGQYQRVSSAVITLNGAIVAGPNAFNQAVSVIDAPVPLQAANTLTVELRSQPNSGLTIEIFALDAGDNHPPVANAGPDQTTQVGQTVTLNGALSTDPDGDLLSFHWTAVSLPAGSVASLSDPTAVSPVFVVDRPGTYEFALRVNDGFVDSDADIVRVTTVNSPPTANAGPDQTAAVGATATLNGGASSDVDGDALTFLWGFVSRPAGSTASLSDQTAAMPTFTVDVAGSYVVRLVVNDGTVDSAPDTVTISTTNSRPTANAGADQTAPVGATVTLDGNASSDIDGDPLTFHWSFLSRPAGSLAALSDPTSTTPSFTIDQAGTYVAQLIVNDGALDSLPDTVTISTLNSRPTANAGADQTAPVGALVTLDGSGSTDADGDALTFHWSFASRPAGSSAVLSDPSAVSPTFTIDQAGPYVLQLVVNDGTLDSDPDTSVISTSNSAPVARAGADQSARVGDTVTLDGSASADVDGDPLIFRWALVSVPAGSAASLSDTAAVMPSFTIDRPGVYVAQLIVNDGTIDSAPDTVSISTVNSAPVANAGADQSAPVGTTILLDGSGSTDADGDVLTYRWAFTSVPPGSTATLSDPLAVSPSFMIDRAGEYVVQLTVNDGTVDSAADAVMISTTNSRPVANAGPDQSVLTADTVTLDGSASTDADGNSLSFRWAITSRPVGSTATLSDPFAMQPQFVADAAGAFVVQLIVNDGFVDSDPDTVAITVRVPVPDTVGRTQAEAASIIVAAGLIVGAITNDFSDTVPAGAVISQSPTAGTIVAGGTAVDLVVSLGPAVTVPDVTGMTEADAGAALAAQGLVVGVVTTANSDTVPAGHVISQSPVGGTVVADGSAVDLVISLGVAVPVLTSIAVTPANATRPRGQTQQYAAVGTFSDGHTEDLTASVIWQSTNLAAASINGAGLATALDAGATTIGATKESVTGSTTLTVSAAELASIVVTPANSIILTTQTLQFVATGVLTDGTSENLTAQVIWASSDPSIAAINAAGVASGVAEGPVVISATKTGITGSTPLTVQLTVADPTAPTVAITSPANNASVTAAVNIVGTASDANFSKYVLEYAPAGTTAFTPISTGTSPVVNGVLGVFDPTLLLNDLYTVQVKVFDRGGNITSASRVLQVSRDVKVGNFTLTFTDLNVPMAGLPITVNRVYDSRDKRPGDFGIGWRLDIQTLRLRTNRNMSDGWNGTKSGGLFPNYCVTAADDHKVSITLADGTVEEFDMAFDQPCAQLVPPQTANVIWQRRPGTRGSLASIDQPGDVWFFGAFPGTIEVWDGGLTDLFNPQVFRYTTYEGNEFIISKTAGVTSAKDRNGNTLTFTPNGIIHSSGASVTFARDAQGRITTMTAPDGKVSTYTTDANGDLKTYADPAGNTTRYYYNLSHGIIEILDARGLRPLKNEYDNTGRLVAHVDSQGRRVEYTHTIGTRQEIVMDRNGGQSVYEYDTAGNVVKITDPLGKVTSYTFDARGNKLSETDPLGKTTTFTYDANNNRLSESDPLGHTTSRTFNARGQILTQTDPLGRVTTSTYNAAGNMLTSKDAANNTSTFTYDAKGNQLTATNPLGQTTTSVYDANGRQTRRTDALGNVFQATYDAAGRRLTETNPRGGVTRYTYDAAGREISVEDPMGGISRSEYDGTGNKTATIDATGRRTEYTYDAANRLLSTKFADGTTVVNTYDAEGNMTSVTDQLGRTTTITYDGRKQKTRTTFADGSFETYTYDDAGRLLTTSDQLGLVSEAQYDAAGREIKTIDPLGNATTLAYDNANNLTSRTDPGGHTTQFAYDQLNRITVVTHPGGQTTSQTYDAAGRQATETDANGRVTTFEYDANGHVTRVTDAAGGVTQFEYDPAGNRTAVVDARGNRTTFTFDLNNRLTAMTRPNGAVEQYAYDAAGRMVARTDAMGRTISFTYDAAGRLVTRAYPGGAQVQFTYTATGKRATAVDARGTTQYAYDVLDRLTSLTYPDGQQITYTYDASGNLLSISSLAGTISYIYNQGRLHSVTDPAGRVTTFAYDATGNRVGLSYPNGTGATYIYDANDRLTQLTHSGPAGQLASYGFTLDANGQRTRIDESTGRIRNYTYDVLSRLIGEQVTDAAAAPVFEDGFTYDEVGNRLTKTSSAGGGPAATINYAYNIADELTSETGAAYAYDANGNLISKTTATGVTAYEYDFDNRLVRVTAPGGSVTTYRYDADGNRVEKQDSSGTVRYLVDTNRDLAQVLAEYTPAGALTASFVYADDLISMTRGAQVSFYHFDGNGSTRLLSNLAGLVTDTYEFDAFGTLVTRTGATDNPFLFTGQAFDANSGFYYLRARWYQPSTGRFLTLDTHSFSSSDPRSLHRYVYTVNDPVNHTDPTGQFGLGSISISISINSILSGIASLSLNVLIDYVLAKVTGAEFNIFVSVGTALAFGAIGKAVGLGIAAVRRSPNTIRLLQAAARRGIAEHTRWTQLAREALRQAGRVEGFCPSCFTLNKGIRDLTGKVVRNASGKYARPDYVDYANHLIMDLKPVPKAIFDAGEEAMERYLNSTYAAQKKFYIEVYAKARGIAEDAVSFAWDVYVK